MPCTYRNGQNAETLMRTRWRRNRKRFTCRQHSWTTYHCRILWENDQILKRTKMKEDPCVVSHQVCRNFANTINRQGQNFLNKLQLTIPGNPSLTPLTMSQIFLAFSITSSLVCNLGIGYWKTQHPTVSSELEICKAKKEFHYTKMMHWRTHVRSLQSKSRTPWRIPSIILTSPWRDIFVFLWSYRLEEYKELTCKKNVMQC